MNKQIIIRSHYFTGKRGGKRKIKTKYGKNITVLSSNRITYDSNNLNNINNINNNIKKSLQIAVKKLYLIFLSVIRKVEAGHQKLNHIFNIIKEIKCHQSQNQISLIQKTPYSHSYYFQKDEYSKKIEFNGITKFIKNNFFPHYKDSENKLSSNLRKRKRTCLKYGLKHGELVHSQIERFIALFNGHKFNQPNSTINLDSLGTIDPCLLRFIGLLLEKKWLPITCEYKVCVPIIKCATSIDVILLDTININLIMAEVKTGYENIHYDINIQGQSMLYPFTYLGNCPLYHHYLQLMISNMLFYYTTGVHIRKNCIIRLLSKQKQYKVYYLDNKLVNKTKLEELYKIVGYFKC